LRKVLANVGVEVILHQYVLGAVNISLRPREASSGASCCGVEIAAASGGQRFDLALVLKKIPSFPRERSKRPFEPSQML